MIPFGPWAPDQPYLEGALSEALNVIPYGEKYRALPTASDISVSTVSGDVLAGFSSRLVAGNSKTYAATASAIYERNGAGWTNVSGATYTITSGNRWEFTQYDDDIYAASIDETLSVQAGGAGSFTNVSGGPVAACIANVRRWVIVGDVVESAVNIPHKVRWCAIDDPSDWAISEATQSGAQELDAKDGRVTAIRGGEFGLIFQQHAITRMSFVGAPVVWQFDKIDNRNGCEAAGSAVQVGRAVYFLSHDGWRVTDGSGESVNIGEGLVNNWFRSRLNTSYKHKIRGAYNPDWRCVVWTFPSTDGGGSNDSLLLYHIPSKRWTRGDYGADVLFEGATSSVTLDGLDTYFSSLDEVSPGLDDPFWIGGEYKFLGIAGGLLQTYDNTPGTARIETFDTQKTIGRKTRIQIIEPVIDGTVTVQIGYKNLPSESVTYTAASVVNSRTGQAPFQHVSRWQRYRFNVTGSFYDAVGFNVSGKPAGIV